MWHVIKCFLQPIVQNPKILILLNVKPGTEIFGIFAWKITETIDYVHK